MDEMYNTNGFYEDWETEDNVTSNVTGEVTGNVAGNHGNVTGNLMDNDADGFYMDSEGYILNEEPCSRNKLATKLNISKTAVQKTVQKLKKYHLEEDLFFRSGLTTFAQKEIQIYRSMKASEYEKINPPLETSYQKNETSGSIQLRQPEANTAQVNNIEPEVIPTKNWDCEDIANVFSNTQLAKRNGTEALQSAVDIKSNNQNQWRTFQEAELRDIYSQGWEQGAMKAKAYVAAENAAFQQFMQAMGKPLNNGNQSSEE